MEQKDCDLSEEEKRQAEVMRLLEKIKDNKNGPEHAKRRITALDKMVAGLKKQRKTCGEQMEEDLATMAWIDGECDKINKIYIPLCKKLDERLETRRKLIANITNAEAQMQSFITGTRSTFRSARTSYCTLQSKGATRYLEATRGYTCRSGSTQAQFRKGGKPVRPRAASTLLASGDVASLVAKEQQKKYEGSRPDSAADRRARARSGVRPHTSMN